MRQRVTSHFKRETQVRILADAQANKKCVCSLVVRMPKNTQVDFPYFIFYVKEKNIMKEREKEKNVEDYERIEKIIAYMDFATKLKMAQEAKRKKKEKDSNK